MSNSLEYEDLWKDLYDWAKDNCKETADMMEEMDVRLIEEWEA